MSDFQPLHFALAFQNPWLLIAAQSLSRPGCSRPAALRARERGEEEAAQGRSRRWLLLLLPAPAPPPASSCSSHRLLLSCQLQSRASLAASAAPAAAGLPSRGTAPPNSGAAAKRGSSGVSSLSVERVFVTTKLAGPLQQKGFICDCNFLSDPSFHSWH